MCFFIIHVLLSFIYIHIVLHWNFKKFQKSSIASAALEICIKYRLKELEKSVYLATLYWQGFLTFWGLASLNVKLNSSTYRPTDWMKTRITPNGEGGAGVKTHNLLLRFISYLLRPQEKTKSTKSKLWDRRIDQNQRSNVTYVYRM